jgi:hypothetical protein
MDLQTEKLTIIQQLLEVHDEQLIVAIQEILAVGLNKDITIKDSDFWEELTASQIAQIQLSRKQHRDGLGIPHEQVMTDFREKLNR